MWPEAVPDVSQHAGLLSLWHGKDHHVPSDFLGREGRVRFSIVMHIFGDIAPMCGGGGERHAFSGLTRSHVIETGSAGAHSCMCLQYKPQLLFNFRSFGK